MDQLEVAPAAGLLVVAEVDPPVEVDQVGQVVPEEVIKTQQKLN